MGFRKKTVFFSVAQIDSTHGFNMIQIMGFFLKKKPSDGIYLD